MGKPQETRNRIIRTAVELAKQKGPDTLPVKEICEGAHISKNTFYQYFTSKEEVFGSTYATSDDDKMAALPEILLKFDSPLEQFWEFNKIDIARQTSFGPKLLATIAMQNVLNDYFCIEEEETLSPAIKVSLSLIQKMQKAKEIKNMADPFLLLRTMYDCAIGIDIRWTKTNGGFDLKREIYDQMMLVLQPSVEITNYD